MRNKVCLYAAKFPKKFGISSPSGRYLTTNGINRFKLLEEVRLLEIWEYLFEQHCEHHGLKHLFLYFNILINWVMLLAGT